METLTPKKPSNVNDSYASESESDAELGGTGGSGFSPGGGAGSGRGDLNRLDNIEADMKSNLKQQARLSQKKHDAINKGQNNSIGSNSNKKAKEALPGTWVYFMQHYSPRSIYDYYVGYWNLSSSYWISRMNALEAPFARRIRGVYPVNQVYVCFNTERDKRACMEDLEVPDAQIYFPWLYGDIQTRRFRGMC